MSLRQISFGVLIVSLFIGSGLSPAGVPVGTVFTFQGQLKDAGVPANGPHNFVFRLFDNQNAQIGSAVTVNGHPVDNGLFSVELDFGPGVFTGDQRELEIQVNGNVLTPRQPLNAMPYAMYALNGPGAGGAWTVNGAHIHNTNPGNVGIGTTAPLHELHVRGDNATLRLEDNDSVSSFTLFEDAQPTQLRISKTNSNGLVLLDLNPKPTDGVSGADVRFFRETNTAGLKTVRFLQGNNTTAASAVIGVDGADSWFALHGGEVGIGTNTPKGRLHVDGDYYGRGHLWLHAHPTDGISGTAYVQARDDSGTSSINLRLRTQSVGNVVDAMTLTSSGNVGIGTSFPNARLHVLSGADASSATGGFMIIGNEFGLNLAFDNNEVMARDAGIASTLLINRDGGDVLVGSASGGTSRLSTPILQITGGSDLSERFDVAGMGELAPKPGMVVCIDPTRPGKLIPSSLAYDRTVAGVISGANGIRSGMVMGQRDSEADGAHAVALSGRVWVHCVAAGSISPGDLLTTSDTPGHAMKATDFSRAQGAVIGKAMTSLPEGRGLVLVLVTLQ